MASARVVIADTGPLLTLSWIHRIGLLDDLFDRVVVPFDVWAELAHRPDASEPPQVAALEHLEFSPPEFVVPEEAALLDPGEQAVVALAARRFPQAVVLIDEKRGRRAATALGLHVVGSLGVLLEGKRHGLVASVAPLVSELISSGVYFGPLLVRRVLEAAGEQDSGQH